MNEHIASFPSTTLYDDLLVSDPSVAKRTLATLPTISDAFSEDIRDTLDPPVVFFDTAGCEFFERSEADSEGNVKVVKGSLGEGSRSNENEAVVVAKWARKLVRHLEISVYSYFFALPDYCPLDCSRRTRSRDSGCHPISSSGITRLDHVTGGFPGNDYRKR